MRSSSRGQLVAVAGEELDALNSAELWEAEIISPASALYLPTRYAPPGGYRPAESRRANRTLPRRSAPGDGSLENAGIHTHREHGPPALPRRSPGPPRADAHASPRQGFGSTSRTPSVPKILPFVNPIPFVPTGDAPAGLLHVQAGTTRAPGSKGTPTRRGPAPRPVEHGVAAYFDSSTSIAPTSGVPVQCRPRPYHHDLVLSLARWTLSRPRHVGLYPGWNAT
jgi:hypothetical protein